MLLFCKSLHGVEKSCGLIDVEFHLLHFAGTLRIMSGEIKSKGGAEIEIGDTVSAPYRGGKHEFEVGNREPLPDILLNRSSC